MLRRRVGLCLAVMHVWRVPFVDSYVHGCKYQDVPSQQTKAVLPVPAMYYMVTAAQPIYSWCLGTPGRQLYGAVKCARR